MIIVPEQSVHRTRTKHARTVIIGACPNLMNDILREGMFNQFDEVVVVYHVQGISVV